jgi:hypothetical protein
MRRISSTILIRDEPRGEVYSIEPFDTVEMMGDLPDGLLLGLDDYITVIDGKPQNVAKRDAVKYVTFLHVAISGSYIRASKAKMEEAP